MVMSCHVCEKDEELNVHSIDHVVFVIVFWAHTHLLLALLFGP